MVFFFLGGGGVDGWFGEAGLLSGFFGGVQAAAESEHARTVRETVRPHLVSSYDYASKLIRNQVARRFILTRY